MRPVLVNKLAKRSISPDHQIDGSGSYEPFTGCRLDDTSRHDAQLLSAPSVPVDPYAAWLAQRDADSGPAERPQVRWVHRPRVQIAAVTADASEERSQVRWVHRRGLSGPAVRGITARDERSPELAGESSSAELAAV